MRDHGLVERGRTEADREIDVGGMIPRFGSEHVAGHDAARAGAPSIDVVAARHFQISDPVAIDAPFCQDLE